MFDTDIKSTGMDFDAGRVDNGDPWSRLLDEDMPQGKKKHQLDSDKNLLS